MQVVTKFHRSRHLLFLACRSLVGTQQMLGAGSVSELARSKESMDIQQAKSPA
jgi:hypothetical protein